MTTHTAEGLRPSPRPRPDGGDPEHDHVDDPWTDWSWPDAGWTRPDAGWNRSAGPVAGSPDPADDTADDTAAHRFTGDDDEDDEDEDRSGLDHLDPGRAGWLPLLDDDVVDHDLRGRRHGRAAAGTPVEGSSRRRRRVVGALGALAAVSVGFLGGIVADRMVAGAGDDGTARLAGQVETDADGTLAVRGVDGGLTAVRTSTGTRVVTANPVAGDLPAGTMVDVWTRRTADGALEATAVAVRP